MAYSLSDAELNLLLNINPNTREVEEALRNIAHQMALAFDPARRAADEAMVDIAHSLARQREELERIRLLSDPALLRERVRLEREIAQARRDSAAADLQENIRQAGGRRAYNREQRANRRAGGGQRSMLGAILGAHSHGGSLGATGGAIGAHLSGGSATGAIMGSAIARLIPDVIAAPAKMVVGSLNLVANALRQLQGPLGPIGAGFMAVGSIMQGVTNVIKTIPVLGQILGPLGDTLSAIPGIFASVTESLVSMAAKASPGQFKLFTMALEDTQAVIGQAFLPILNLMTEAIRAAGDVLANIMPSADMVAYAIQPFREGLYQLKDALIEVGPSLQILIVAGIKAMAIALRDLMKWLTGVSKQVADWVGVCGGKETKGSVGAAARPVSFQGFSEYEKEIQKAAFMMPGSQVSIGDNVGDIKKRVDQLADYFGSEKFIEDIGKGIWAVLKMIDQIGGKGIGAAINGAINWRPTFSDIGSAASAIFGNPVPHVGGL